MPLTEDYEQSKFDATLRQVNECHRQQMETELIVKKLTAEVEELKHERLTLSDQVKAVADKLEKLKAWTIGKLKPENEK